MTSQESQAPFECTVSCAVEPFDLNRKADDVPNTPMTTISAAMGHCEAAVQEIASRSAAEQLHTEVRNAHKKNRKDSAPVGEKSSSNLKRVLKSFTTSKKAHKSESEKNSKALAQNAHDGNIEVHDQRVLNKVSDPQFAPQDIPVNQSLNAPDDNYIEPSAICQQQRSVKAPEQCDSSSQYPQLPVQAQSNTGSYGIILGGQIPHLSSRRAPSTYFTLTNANSYAISGRSRFVSGRHVASQHAEVQDMMPQPAIDTLPATYRTNRSPMFEPLDVAGHQLAPRFAFDWPNLDTYRAPSNYPGIAQALDFQSAAEPRRSVSVPADMMRPTTLRGSAVPSPLNTHRHRFQIGEPQTPLATAPSSILDQPLYNNPYSTASRQNQASRQVRNHNEIEASLETRLDRIEEKLDRVLSLVTHDTSDDAPGDHQRKMQQAQSQSAEKKMYDQVASQEQVHGQGQRQRQKRQRQRDIRANLTGMPPHIPYGGIGLEGWYEAVNK